MCHSHRQTQTNQLISSYGKCIQINLTENVSNLFRLAVEMIIHKMVDLLDRIKVEYLQDYHCPHCHHQLDYDKSNCPSLLDATSIELDCCIILKPNG